MRQSIDIVTFNENESDAVDALLTDLARSPSVWNRSGPRSLESRPGRQRVIRHLPVNAQGNVVAAAALAGLYGPKNPPTYVVFYGCAGAASTDDVGSVFLVEATMYLSLGTVLPADPDGEIVTLKNKWICVHDPEEVRPLPPIGFPLATQGGTIDLPKMTGIPRAQVAATDKVVKVSPGIAPVPLRRHFGSGVWQKQEWTYGDAIAHAADQARPTPLLIEMESYGIGRLAESLKLLDRIAVLRVTTDHLVDHGGSGRTQRQLLFDGRHALALTVLALLDPTNPRLRDWRSA